MPDYPIECPVCGEELADAAAVEAHDHQAEPGWDRAGGSFQCPECGIRFDEADDLVAHQGEAHPSR